MMPREGRYYVEYLGWKETRGLHGNDYTDPVVKKLYSRRQSEGGMHRMTIKITRDDLQISQHKTGSNGKTSKIKYPAQPMCDVSYVAQCSPPYTDVVGCIFLGYNMYTHCAAHVHGYRFDSPDTAAMFAKQVNSIIAQSEYRQRIMAMEQDLSQLGHVNARTNGHGGHDMIGSDAGSYGSHSPISSDSGVPHEVSYPTAEEALKARKDIVIKRSASQKKQQSPKLFSTLQDELSHKLSMQEQKETPILLPPKDYDTIVRRYGHLSIRAKVKQRSIVGADSIFRSTIPESSSASSDGNNNKDAQTRKKTAGYPLQQTASSSSIGKDSHDRGSNHSGGADDDPSVFGLYRGLKQDDGSILAQDEMVMWSPEFSFGHQSASSESSGVNSARSSGGLRRTNLESSTR